MIKADQRAAAFIPSAPPVVVDDVYTPEQIDGLLAAVRAGPPRRLLTAELFSSAEELMIATSGSVAEGVSFDMFLDPMFRGDLGQHGVSFHPAADAVLYNEKLLNWARRYRQTDYVCARQLHFNVASPMKCQDPGHYDSPSFRGLSHTNTPIWLLSVMANSRLFEEFKSKLVAVVTWFWRSSDQGGFTYWPDGADKAPQRIAAPFWNRGIVAENESMFHRGESIGTPEQWGVSGLTFESVFEGDPDSTSGWRMRSGDKVIGRFATEELRWLFHWTALTFTDYQDFKRHVDHLDDLTHERVVDTLLRDLRAQGIAISTPSDPLHDEEFKMTLLRNYAIGSPKTYPVEAPVYRAAA